MISQVMWQEVDAVMRRYWHYNDEGKAYTPETYTPFMVQYVRIDRTYRKKRNYETLVKEFRETEKTAGKGNSDPFPMTAEAEDDAARAELRTLFRLEQELEQVCDPAGIKIPLWEPGNIPDMRKNPDLWVVCSDATASESLDPEDYMPNFVPYLLEGEGKRPVILVLAGGHRGNYTSGDPVCRYFNRIGCHAVLMGHRVGIQKLNFCLDLQRAIRMLRFHAEEWNIDPEKIGAIGLSFGGVVITDYIEQLRFADVPSQYDPAYREDAVDQMSGTLNAFLGIYTSSDPFLPRSKDLDYSQYPPVFLVLPGADPMVDFQVGFLNDLIRHQVRAEAHLFDGGIHGFGLGDGAIVANGKDGHIPAIALWPELARLWLIQIFGEWQGKE